MPVLTSGHDQTAGGRALNEWLTRQLNVPMANIGRVVEQALREEELIEDLIDAQGASQARIRYGSAKSLLLLAGKKPAAVYPYFNVFVQQLDSPNQVLGWMAARILAALAAVDTEGQVERLLPQYLGIITRGRMIAAANVMCGAAAIATANPELADTVARGILAVRKTDYETSECWNVAAGHAVESLSRFYPLISRRKPVLEFVSSLKGNSRPATRKKAEKFLKRWAPAATPTKPGKR